MNKKKGLTKAQQEFILNASKDQGTGVLNRGATMDQIEEFIQGPGKQGQHALVMLDMDNLKALNDTLGHQSGDAAIFKVAQTIKDHFRNDDIIGRIGGDEFFAFIKNVDSEIITKKMKELMEKLQFVYENGGKRVSVSASAGIASYNGKSGKNKNLRVLYAEADAALYKAKAAGKNTFSFAGEFEDIDDLSEKAEVVAWDLQNLLNNLGAGIAIFHGDSVDEMIPVFCNDGYLSLSGLSHEDFKIYASKGALYGIHPEDIDETRERFIEAYYNHHPLQHTMRIRRAEDVYKWVSMFGNIKYNADGSFELYVVFSDADEAVKEQRIETERYNNFVEREKNLEFRTMSSLHLNLTTNQCTIIHRRMDVHYEIETGGGVDEFVNSGAANIDDESSRIEFLGKFCRKALKESFEKGIFDLEIKIPIRLRDNRVLWCRQTANLSRNPVTKDVEAILVLTRADRDIRTQLSFETMMETDYVFIANANIETGLTTVIREQGCCSPEAPDSRIVLYEDLMREKIKELISEDYYEDCIESTKIKAVLSVLDNSGSFCCTFPANHSAPASNSVYQWRFAYMGESKKEILITCIEMISFLDRRNNMEIEWRAEQVAAAAAEESEKIETSHRSKILIAEDAKMNRDMLKMIFEDDFGIIEAEDGEEAIELIDRNFDSLALIIIDLKMPKKTGLDVLIHLNLRGLSDSIPVIMVTGEGTRETDLRSLEYGISDIIYKPFDSRIVRMRALNLIELYARKEATEKQLEKWKSEAIEMRIQSARTRNKDEKEKGK